MKFQNIIKTARNYFSKKIINQSFKPQQHYQPTFYLPHNILQTVCQLLSPIKQIQFQRQKIYFIDGGHLSLDWVHNNQNKKNPPILLIMHGLTGGSQSNYIKALVQKGIQQNYCCVCLNSRGINSQMTSPIPYLGYNFHQLQTALERIQSHYPQSPIYMIGTSFGGNYLLRYLLNNTRNTLKGFVGLSMPFSIRYVIDSINKTYQKVFLKTYMNSIFFNHPIMKYWEDIGLVDLKYVKQSISLRQFHTRLTTKLLGIQDVNQIFQHYQINNEKIIKLNYPTLLLTAKDDPIVGFQSYPITAITNNKNIKFLTTQHGGHLCWFQGNRPSRWYPKPVFNFLRQLRQKNNNQK